MLNGDVLPGQPERLSGRRSDWLSASSSDCAEPELCGLATSSLEIGPQDAEHLLQILLPFLRCPLVPAQMLAQMAL